MPFSLVGSRMKQMIQVSYSLTLAQFSLTFKVCYDTLVLLNVLSCIVLGIALSGVLLVANVTFNHKYDNSRPIVEGTAGQAPISVSDLEDLKGNLISLHGNGSIFPTWMVSGRWSIAESPSNSTNTTSSNIKFNANVTMASVDGTGVHRHKLTGFNLSNSIFHNKSATINGTVSFTSSGSNIGIPEENFNNIPIIIKIMNLRTISINLDNKMVNQHFGNSPIYGKID